MASHSFGGVRLRRFAVALTLVMVGPMALPGGPLHGDRLLALSHDLRAHAQSLSRRTLTRDARTSSSIAKSPDRQIATSEDYGRLPLSFEINRGQTDARVRFLSRGQGYAFFLTETGATLSLQASAAAQATSEASMSGRRGSAASGGGAPRAFKEARAAAVTMSLVGARKHPRIGATDELPGRVNYFRGNDPAKWRTDIPTYARVRYEDVYRGIDLVYYGTTPKVRLKPDSTTIAQLEYDFIVTPGADPSRIRLAFEGVDEISIDDNGDLVLTTAVGEIRQHKPVIYQEVDGKRREIDGGYQLGSGVGGQGSEKAQSRKPKAQSQTVVAFSVADYDRARPLVIDPTLAYSTFLGGSNFDQGFGIAVDAAGSAYVTGVTLSSDFPTTGSAVDTDFNTKFDAFVTKLNAAGSAPVYSTFLGGSGDDLGVAVAVDTTGAAYVTGETDSSNFPTTTDAADKDFNGGIADVFVTKLNAAGSALAYSTFLGGSLADVGRGIAIDATGAAYITGVTLSSNFPTLGAFDTIENGTTDAFVTKLNAAGALAYSTFLGGDSNDEGFGIAVDATGAAYVTGVTLSSNFPATFGAVDTTHNGSTDAFVTKLNAAGALAYSTFLGGGSIDEGFGIAVDATGAAYVTGFTISTNFPTTMGAFNTSNNGVDDVFVTKLNVAGTALAYSTYLGGINVDQGHGIAVDASGAAYVTGRTDSTGFPTTGDAFDTSWNLSQDTFVTRLNANGTALLFSTFFDGSFDDQGHGITVDGGGNAYVTGFTASSDFLTTAGGDTSYNGLVDAFVTKVVFLSTPPASLTVTKTVAPGADPGRFNLQIDGATAGTGANVGDAGTTGAVGLGVGSHTVSETAGTSTTLGDYITVIGGDCAADGTITLADGDNKTCTITNTRKPRLAVIKVLSPIADPGKFNLQIDGLTAGTGANVGDGGTTGTIMLGTIGLHTVGETAGTATALGDYITLIAGDCLSNGNITLFAGDVKTCTITNYRKPRLTITKVLVPSNDVGKFNLQLDGVTIGTGTNVGNGGTTGVVAVGSLGLHTVGEAAGTGTTLIDYTRVISGDCASDGSITLNAGDVKTCTITNTRIVEIPSLTATPSSMFPADRRMVRVTLTPTTTDLLSLPVTCAIQSIAANTAQLGAGPDYIIYPPLAADLRAERPSGGVARAYTMTVRCTDASGAGNNRSVVVPVLGVR